MNKKVLFLSAVLLSISLFAFTEGTDHYLVQNVTGTVQIETAKNKWSPVTIGMEISASATINTGLNSTLALKKADKTVTIKPMKKGSVEKLFNSASAKNGIVMGSKLTNSDISAATSQRTTSTATASSRASDATLDMEWAE